ncbi:hypothetical protein OSB04_017366 [Centaurea solstitialis]|uniref:Retrotransposon gag domain-containing protein n=1 Tax=Centaurea solstitialis TaxID=347529 RepID=A0AA38TFY3_9ASTR|nr:hypothetical protein OSB04_017366 [Centaurea solstitialis]
MANTRSQTGAARGPPDQTASTADQRVRVETVESPLRPQVLGGGPEHVPRVNLEDPNPLLTEVTPKMRMLDNVMKAVNEAMSKQQESFMKMLEDRNASHRRNEAVGENAGTASGDAEVIVVTEETRTTGDKGKEKAKAKGCSYKNFLGCKPPEFRGCSDLVVCMYWLREMEMAFEASECDASQRVKFASHLLKGEALTWWNLTRSSLTPKVYARLSWDEFKKKMLEKYCSERALDKIEDELWAMKKGNSPISFYAKDFLEKLGMVDDAVDYPFGVYLLWSNKYTQPIEFKLPKQYQSEKNHNKHSINQNKPVNINHKSIIHKGSSTMTSTTTKNYSLIIMKTKTKVDIDMIPTVQRRMIEDRLPQRIGTFRTLTLVPPRIPYQKYAKRLF